MLKQGAVLSHYQILEPIGRGGMGVVYKAEDSKLKRIVALKLLLSQSMSDEVSKERFIQEARTASTLDHPNICTIYEVDETPDGDLFFAMALYDGETLRPRIQRGPLSISDALDIAAQVALGLAKAHEAGIVHRDIKPANLMITLEGLVKILDFGLAKLTGDQTRLTLAGTAMGTLAYMSPEQVLGGPLDQRTDIWSLGVVVYEMVTGQLPFKAESNAAMGAVILQVLPTPLTAVRTGVPIELERVVNRALSKNPDDRYQTVKDMLSELRRLKRDTDEPHGESALGVAAASRLRFRAESEESDDIEYHQAIKAARSRIWISQTWFPGIERDASEIAQTNIPELRLLLTSFKDGSPIYARMASRKLKASRGKANVESSVRVFVENDQKGRLRFCYGHHPGWIAIVDSWVFWGPTPVGRDNHSIDFLFHKHPAGGTKGRFWIEQFELLWDHYSHDYDAEAAFNEELQDT